MAACQSPWEYGKGLPPRFEDIGEEIAFGREWQAGLAGGRLVEYAWPAMYSERRSRSAPIIVTEELTSARTPSSSAASA